MEEKEIEQLELTAKTVPKAVGATAERHRTSFKP